MSDFKKFCIDEKLSPVQIVGARKAWQEQQAIIDDLKAQLNNMEVCYIEKKKEVEDQQKRIDKYKKLTTSIRNEFDLWTDGREFADVIEAQIENLEALRGGHE